MSPANIDGEPETVLLALGRVAWAAINVEDRAGSLAENVLQRSRDKSQIGAFVREAIAALGSRQAAPGIVGAIDWFDRSSSALVERNQIMHSIPAVLYPGDGETFLVHWPNSGGPPVETPLNAEVLNEVADRLQGIVAEWSDVWMALEEHGDSA